MKDVLGIKGWGIGLLSFLLLFGCARFERTQYDELALAAESEAEENAAGEYTEYTIEEQLEEIIYTRTAEPRFVIIPPSARPGEPVTVGFSYNFDGCNRQFQAALLDSRGRRIARAQFFHTSWRAGEQEVRAAVLAVPSTALIGNAFIRIQSDDDIMHEMPFTIYHREFYSERIALDQRNTTLRTAPDPQRTLESQQLWAILNRTGREILHFGPFERPVTSTRRTSIYGSRRVFVYVDGSTDTAIHAGVDYGVPTGTEVRASGAGRVVLARNRILTGNSVILEHLPGLYSIYYHLDSIDVSEGSIVDMGTLLGKSGATGLATGPHLHWEVRVSGENADPDAFLSRPILDKNEIIDRLTAY